METTNDSAVAQPASSTIKVDGTKEPEKPKSSCC